MNNQQPEGIPGKTKGKGIMIIVGCEPTVKMLFLNARKYSAGTDCNWFVLCVDPGSNAGKLSRSRFSENLSAAILTGAKVFQLYRHDLSVQIAKLSAENEISRILIGNFKGGNHGFRVKAAGLYNELRRKLPEIEVIHINMKQQERNIKKGIKGTTGGIAEYLLAFTAVIITAAVCFLGVGLIGYQTVGLILLMLTAVLSLFIGRSAIIFTAVLNFGIWNFFFIPPILTLHIANFHDIILLFANLAVAITGGSLINRLRRNEIDLKQSKEKISLLYSLLESVSNAGSIKEVVRKTREELKRHFNADAVIYLQEKSGNSLEKRAFGKDELFSDEEFQKACLVFENKTAEPVIKLNDQSIIQYFPLSGQRKNIGVIGISADDKLPVDEVRQIFLKSFISQVSSALEREISIDKAKELQVQEESQKLFQTVLNSVSHELRTPVSVISSAVSNLMDEPTGSDPLLRRQICDELDSSVNRLNLLIENILDMSRIDSGYLQLNKQPCDVSDLIGILLTYFKDNLRDHEIKLAVPESTPLILVDINWMKQALINILYNALVYTPSKSIIEITVEQEKHAIALFFRDHGPGVPESALNSIFDKFYRVPGSVSGGTGLGLAITKAIIEAHSGKITATNAPGGGLTITVELPLFV